MFGRQPLPGYVFDIKNKDVKRRYERFRRKILAAVSYLEPGEQFLILNKALPYAVWVHEFDYRRSGELYLFHLIGVCLHLAKRRAPAVGLAIGLLHDTVEDHCSDKVAEQEAKEAERKAKKKAEAASNAANTKVPEQGNSSLTRKAGRSARRHKERPFVPRVISQDEIYWYFGPVVGAGVDSLTKVSVSSNYFRRALSTISPVPETAPSQGSTEAKVLELLQTAGSAKSEDGDSARRDESREERPRRIRSVFEQVSPKDEKSAPGFTPAEVKMILSALSESERKELRRMAKVSDQTDSHCSMLKAFAVMPQIIPIKIADRVNNLLSLSIMPPDKCERISFETRELFVPLAAEVGEYEVKRFFEEQCFRFLEKDEYEELAPRVKAAVSSALPAFNSLRRRLKRIMADSNIRCEVRLQISGPYSAFRKMKMGGLADPADLYNLISVEVITDSRAACVSAMSEIRRLFPRIGAISDSLENPKRNGYRAIHITVTQTGTTGDMADIRISSRSDDFVNRFGLFTSFKSDALAAGLASALQEMAEASSSSTDMLRSLSNGWLERTILIYCPDRHPVRLPIGSVPLDAAFAIDPALGFSCCGAKVGGVSVNFLSHKLVNGDSVYIITSPEARPVRSWCDACQTGRARDMLSKWYSDNFLPQDNIEEGRRILRIALLQYGRPDLFSCAEFMRKLAACYDCEDADRFLEHLGARCFRHFSDTLRENADNILKHGSFGNISVRPADDDISDMVRIDGVGVDSVMACPFCTPIHGDEIKAVYSGLSSGGGVKKLMIVHRSGCYLVKKSIEDAVRDAVWADSSEDSLPALMTDVTIKASDRFELPFEAIQILRSLRIACSEYHVSSHPENGSMEVFVSVCVTGVEQMRALLHELERLKGVSSASRSPRHFTANSVLHSCGAVSELCLTVQSAGPEEWDAMMRNLKSVDGVIEVRSCR